jgi:hypothetical protein
MDGAVVPRVTVKVEGAFPVGMTDVGTTAQVASDGAPAQVRATERLNPLIGVTWRLWVADCPAVSVAVAQSRPAEERSVAPRKVKSASRRKPAVAPSLLLGHLRLSRRREMKHDLGESQTRQSSAT